MNTTLTMIMTMSLNKKYAITKNPNFMSCLCLCLSLHALSYLVGL